MPDHAHLLVSIPDQVSLQEFVRYFKQTAGFSLKQRFGTEAWQVSYFDHILRREESIAAVAEYIWNNPVEAELAASQVEYPLSGPRKLLT